MNKIIPLVLCLLGYSVLSAQDGRQRILMDADWRFFLGDATGADKSGFDDTKWRTLDLPHDWSIEHEFVENAPTGGGGGYLPTGVGWYRHHFRLSGTEVSRHFLLLEFEGVYQNSDVWVNGQHCGHYPNGYMSFYYDIGAFLHKGENVIAVRVDNSQQPNTRYYSGSGIYRHVWMDIAGPVHVAPWGVYITTPLIDPGSAQVAIKTSFVNEILDEAPGHGRDRSGSKEVRLHSVTLRSVILDAAGNEVGHASSLVILGIKGQFDQEQEITVTNPTRWSLEKPYLYSVRTTIVDEGRTTDIMTTPFGIREIKYDVNKGFLLNGTPVKMLGVCLHHDGGSVGAAVPVAVWERRLRTLREMGCNAIRTSHNPVAPEFLDLCDRMGFLVMDEFLDEWKAGKVKYGYHNYFDQWAQKDLVGFIHRDRNHPSVVMWSAGNEIGEQKQDTGVNILRGLIETFHREDPTRPVTTGNDNIAADNGSAKLPFLDALDIVGYNYVDRWHERRELFYDEDRHDHPNWKMVGTESVSIPGVRGDYYGGNFFRVDSSVIRPANMPAVIRAEQLWKYIAVHDFVIGDFMWTGIDYLGEARWPSKNASSGVIDLCGFPKDAYYFYKSRWNPEPMIHLSPHWNWKGHEGQVIEVMAYTNCDSVELLLNGHSFGVKALEFPRQGNSGAWNRYAHTPIGATTGDLHLMWDVPYEPGVLHAIGRKGGKVVCEAEMHTTGAPAAIRLVADKTTIAPGPSGVAQVRIEVVDEHGWVIPDADNMIQLSVSGPGALIGLDNSNPRDHTSMKSSSRKVFNGLALGMIQSAGHPGVIHVGVESPGLKGDNVDISVGKETTLAPLRMRTHSLSAKPLRPLLEVLVNAVKMQPSDTACEILLWPGGAPGSEGKTGPEKVRIAETGDHVVSHVNNPSVTPYLPAQGGSMKTAVIIAPGGGHAELWIDHEGYHEAEFFRDRGIAAFVLKYRLAREPGSTYSVDKDELADIQRAIRLVRSRAKEWGIDPSKIGVMGFSAGGEVAGLSAMRFDSGRVAAADPIERFSSRPDFQALIYPGGAARLEPVTGAPPIFLLGGYKDRPDISEGIARIYLKYKEAGIPAELHVYADQGHGFGMRATNKGAVAGWPERFVEWLKEIGD